MPEEVRGLSAAAPTDMAQPRVCVGVHMSGCVAMCVCGGVCVVCGCVWGVCTQQLACGSEPEAGEGLPGAPTARLAGAAVSAFRSPSQTPCFPCPAVFTGPGLTHQVLSGLRHVAQCSVPPRPWGLSCQCFLGESPLLTLRQRVSAWGQHAPLCSQSFLASLFPWFNHCPVSEWVFLAAETCL